MTGNRLILAATLIATACATATPVREIVTKEVVVTKTERSMRPDQLPAAPTPMASRPASISAALDLAISKLCEYVQYAERADPLMQNAAGLPISPRVAEPVCQR